MRVVIGRNIPRDTPIRILYGAEIKQYARWRHFDCVEKTVYGLCFGKDHDVIINEYTANI